MDDDLSEAEVLAWRCSKALREAPELVMHMRSLIVPGNGQGERGEEDPRERAPLRITPTDGADHLFANLLLWVDYWCEQLEQGLPLPASFVWSNYREVQGFRAGTSVERAGGLTSTLTRWLLEHDVAIGRHPQGGMYRFEIVQLVGQWRGRFPMDPRRVRPAAARPCPQCGELEVRADWWGVDQGDVEVRCSLCGWRADADYRGLMAWIAPPVGEERREEPFDAANPFHAGLRVSPVLPEEGNTNG